MITNKYLLSFFLLTMPSALSAMQDRDRLSEAREVHELCDRVIRLVDLRARLGKSEKDLAALRGRYLETLTDDERAFIMEDRAFVVALYKRHSRFSGGNCNVRDLAIITADEIEHVYYSVNDKAERYVAYLWGGEGIVFATKYLSGNHAGEIFCRRVTECLAIDSSYFSVLKGIYEKQNQTQASNSNK